MKRMKRLSKMLGKKDRKGLDADLFGNDGGPQLGKGLAAAECGYVKMDDPSEPKGKVNQVSPGDAFENFHEDKQEAIRVVLGKKDQAGQLEAMQQEGAC